VVAVGLAVARVRGSWRELLAIQATMALLSLGGSALLVGPFGITGVGVAMIAARVLVAVGVWATRLRPLLATGRSTPA
jgi:hypothetical protein